MKAHELMTTDVVSVPPEAPVSNVAQVLLEHRISAAPVVDSSGTVVGMVSEGDLIGRDETERADRRDWWLTLLAGSYILSADFLARLRKPERAARDVMSSPVIRVTEETDAAEIAALLIQYRIKRVPVVREGKVVGIVSRADLLRALATGERPHQEPDGHTPARNLLADAIASLDHRLFGSLVKPPTEPAPAAPGAKAEGGFSVADFHGLMEDFERHRAETAIATRQQMAAHRREKVKQLIDEHVREEHWNAMLHRAREAAEHGEKELLLLRFPSDLCIDGGRAINAALPEWPSSLRGEPAELYLRWERDLKPSGFHLTARILDYPKGMPGDVGLFLGWSR